MHISHVALWTDQLEVMRSFYETYFAATAGEKYENTFTDPDGNVLELTV